MANGRTYWRIRILRELAREKREIADILAGDGVIDCESIAAAWHYEARLDNELAALN